MGSMGLLGYCFDEKYGGQNADFLYSVVMNEEMPKVGISGFAMGISVHNDVAIPYIANSGSEEQKMRWLPKCCSGEIICALGMTEPGAGSDVAAIRTTAVKEGDHYVINGQKTFITNGYMCDLVVLACKTNPKADPPYTGISLIVVEDGTEGFSRGRKLEKMGGRASDTAELHFEDCRVPAENLLGAEGAGFLVLMQNLQQERLVTAIGTITIADTMLKMTIEYCKSREAFGRPISKFQYNTFKLVEMATEIEMARTFTYSLIDDYLAGEDITLKCSMAKWYNSELANRVAYDCVQLHGGYGYMLEYPIAKLYTDIRGSTIAAGTTEVMKGIIGKMIGL